MSIETTHRFHLRCVVCGNNFGSEYDPTIKAYPVYHPKKRYPVKICELSFHQTLSLIYGHLANSETSVSAVRFMTGFGWKHEIALKKDYVSWCLAVGLLGVDGLNRIVVPDPILDHLGEFIPGPDGEIDPMDEAWAMRFKKGLQSIQRWLDGVPRDKMPFKSGELNLGESLLFHKLDTSKVTLRSERAREMREKSALSPRPERKTHLRGLIERKKRRIP